MSQGLIIALALIAVLMTDVALAVLFLSVRPLLGRASAPTEREAAAAAELRALVARTNARAEAAATQIETQQAELRRLLTVAQARPRLPEPTTAEQRDAEARDDADALLDAARRAGISVEEVRLRHALAKRRASA